MNRSVIKKIGSALSSRPRLKHIIKNLLGYPVFLPSFKISDYLHDINNKRNFVTYFLGEIPVYWKTLPKRGDVLVGIPIIENSCLLDKLLASIDHPCDILIIDNNITSGFEKQLKEIVDRYRSNGMNIFIFEQRRNVGCAASWNIIARYGMLRGYRWYIIGNNDIFFMPGALEKVIGYLDSDSYRPGAVLWTIVYFACFAINEGTINKIGWFDENFYPAYCEDDDYKNRIYLAGYLVELLETEWRNCPLGVHDLAGCLSARNDKKRNDAFARRWSCSKEYLNFKYELYGKLLADGKFGHKRWPNPVRDIDNRDWRRPNIIERLMLRFHNKPQDDAGMLAPFELVSPPRDSYILEKDVDSLLYSVKVRSLSRDIVLNLKLTIELPAGWQTDPVDGAAVRLQPGDEREVSLWIKRRVDMEEASRIKFKSRLTYRNKMIESLSEIIIAKTDYEDGQDIHH